jgi:hypothetical protein
MAMRRKTFRSALVLLLMFVAACRCGGGDAASDADVAGGCTFASCELECRAMGRCYGSCTGGSCGCITSCDDADGGPEDVQRDDGGTGDADTADDAGDVTIETREGGSPGVGCRKVPVPRGRTVPPAAGLGSAVFHSGSNSVDAAPPDLLYRFDWSTHLTVVLDDMADVVSAGTKWASYPAVDGTLVAYVRGFLPGATVDEIVQYDLRLLDQATGSIRLLDSIRGEPGRIAMEYVSLQYPWVVWRDVRAENRYAWLAYALNLETGERIDLVPEENGVIGVGLLDGIALVDQTRLTLVNLETGARRLVVDLQCNDIPGSECDGRWGGVITPNWIAWMDSRAFPACGRFAPCRTQIWGWDRRTETEQPLVTSDGMHGPSLAGRGDWLAWEDQRNNPDPYHESYVSSDVYALHLPTMTEIHVDGWAGCQGAPSVYANGAEYHVLFYDSVPAGAPTNDLWDCTLPML